MTTQADYKTMLLRLWELACTDDAKRRPSCQVVDGNFVFTVTGNRERWVMLTQACGVPAEATQVQHGDTLTYTWPSQADAIFGPGGLMAQALPNYEMRRPQLHMARLVQRAIEMQMPALIEAGTGTGKSFAYAAICMAMDLPVVISTSNKALQMQLAKKDIPFLQGIFPGKTLAVAVGKSNYACRLKVEGAERQTCTIANADLQQWYLTTPTGNTEEITFAPDWQALGKITVDDECDGKHCPLYADCFYYQAKAALQGADVTICNHKLLALHRQFPFINLLPAYSVLVVDEAHKLPDVVRDTIGVEFTQPAIDKAIANAAGFAGSDDLEDADAASLLFARELGQFLADKDDMQVGLHDRTFATGQRLAAQLRGLAEAVWPSEDLPGDFQERQRQRRARRIEATGNKVHAVSTPDGLVRWLEPSRRDEPLTLCAKPHDVSAFIADLAGVTTVTDAPLPCYTHCTRCQRELTAAKVAILDGQPFGPECIKHVDPLGDAEVMPLADWLGMDHSGNAAAKPQATLPVIFTSATLAAPDLSAFQAECGLPDALQLVATSPFDYQSNALIYIPQGGAPAPNEQGWQDWLCGELRTLVLSARGGAFLLFTSYSAMRYAVDELRPLFMERGLTTLVQGDYPKLELARRFAADGDAVLFATKSFFEGVDIQGQALRLVVVDKLPFEAPTPLGQAREAAIKAQGKDPFMALRVPRMIIELKQAAGRLIRTQTDTGVIAILDSRLRSHQYGRSKVLPALPDAPLAGKLAMVEAFYAARQVAPAPQDLQWDRIEETRAQRTLKALHLAAVDELPF